MAIPPRSNVDKGLMETPEMPDLEGEDTEIESEEGENEAEASYTVEEDEEGGALITYGGGDEPVDIASLGFGANLAEVLDDAYLSSIAKELGSDVDDDDAGREEWKKAYEEGLTLLGLTYEDRTEPFEGSTGVTHPVLNEAVTQFQAQAYKEMLPPNGPVRSQIVGQVTPEKEQQAERVKNYLNYYITSEMEEYDPEYDQMLYYLGYGGSTFKKVYFDPELGRAVAPVIYPNDLIVPYNARDIRTADRVTHVIKLTPNELRKQQVSGFYRDIDLKEPTEAQRDEIIEKRDKITGIEPSSKPDAYRLYEIHTNLDLEGFEDRDSEGELTGIKLPYIVTMNADTGDVLAIRRNYDPNDPKKRKQQYFVHYKFLPGLGFYGFGLVHLLGNLSRSSTSILRQLIDAGTLSNLPAGFKAKGLRIQDEGSLLQPGEWRDVDAPGGSLRESLLPLPYKEPSATLMQLLGFCIGAAEKFVGTKDLGMTDSNQEMPVGTTIALLERGSRVLSAVHKRLHYSQKQELKLLSRVIRDTVAAYPYDVTAGREILIQDFDDRIDILPVTDPNIFSMTQRISLAQEQLRLAQAAPQMHNQYEAYRRMYSALGVPDIDLILPPPPQPQPEGPAAENGRSMVVPNGGLPLKAFPGQDHNAHIASHLAFIRSPLIQTSPQVYGILLGHVFEHVSLAALEQVQQQMQQMQQQMQPIFNPATGQMVPVPPPPPPPPELIQRAAATIEAQMIADIMQQLSPQQGEDPLVALQKRDLDIREKAVQLKAEEAALRIDLDERKLEAKQEEEGRRRASTEDIQQLRANVSMARAREAKRPPQ
jgi:hypothetical protein